MSRTLATPSIFFVIALSTSGIFSTMHLSLPNILPMAPALPSLPTSASTIAGTAPPSPTISFTLSAIDRSIPAASFVEARPKTFFMTPANVLTTPNAFATISILAAAAAGLSIEPATANSLDMTCWIIPPPLMFAPPTRASTIC